MERGGREGEREREKVGVKVKRKKLKLFLYLTKHHAMKTYWGAEV
jgi:hypothetical protein